MYDRTEDPRPAALRLARWLDGYRELAKGRNIDPEKAHQAWVLQEDRPRVLYVEDVADVLAAFNDLVDSIGHVELIADDSAVQERVEAALDRAREMLGRVA